MEIPARLKIPSNVFFTGTVNIDETTYMFSPKVLDRANVIEFNEVDLPDFSDNQSSGDDFRIKDPNIRGLFQNEEHQPFCTKMDYDSYSSLSKDSNPLAKLFQILKTQHKPVIRILMLLPMISQSMVIMLILPMTMRV